MLANQSAWSRLFIQIQILNTNSADPDQLKKPTDLDLLFAKAGHISDLQDWG